MTRENVLRLAQALATRDTATAGLLSLRKNIGTARPVQGTMESLARTYVNAQRTIDEIVETDIEE